MDDKFGVIYADCPWFYNARNLANKTKFGGGAKGHYPLMKDSELLAMSDWIKSISDKNCALFLWATLPRIDFAIDLLKAFGFRYCTNAFTWIKLKKDGISEIYAPGYYTASNVELCLIGVKGSMRPVRKMIPSVIRSARGRHSEKPEIVRNLICEMYPEAKKIELFAREKAAGWTSWGMTGNMKEANFI